MEFLVLTQHSGLLGPIAKYILGPILNGIFYLLNAIHFPNIGVALFLFTIVVYLLLLPLTIKQQKFSKLQAKMQPELNAIQNKYKGRKDQESQMAMSQETQAVYAKYGVSPAGSCVQLLIQMPILFALYRVINSIPAYVKIVRRVFINDAGTSGIVTDLLAKEGSRDFIQTLSSAKYFTKQFTDFANAPVVDAQNTFIDVLNKASASDWAMVSAQYPDLSSSVDNTVAALAKYNNFLGLNIGFTPRDLISTALKTGSYLIVVGAIMIPVLAAVTQWINAKLIPTANNNGKSGNEQADQMAASMKAMNTFMPIFSAVMCFSFPAGLGLYWIAGSVVRSIQQVLINKHIDSLDLDEEIKKNVEKRNAKLRRAGIDPEKLTQNASLSTKAYNNIPAAKPRTSMAQKAMVNGKPVEVDESSKSSTEYKNKNAEKPGSIASKAYMVKQYNERNNKKD